MGLESYAPVSGKCHRCTYYDNKGATCIVDQEKSDKCRHFFPMK